jgi:hypothetical protein
MNEHSHDPDAELVRKARSGEDSAFERLFRNHASRVLAIATWIVGDADPIEQRRRGRMIVLFLVVAGGAATVSSRKTGFPGPFSRCNLLEGRRLKLQGTSHLRLSRGGISTEPLRGTRCKLALYPSSWEWDQGFKNSAFLRPGESKFDWAATEFP